MAISHALSFPELISPTGLLNGGPQETPWLYVAWHAVLPVAIISFALRRSDANPYPPNSSAAGPIGFTTLGAVGCAIAITWIIAAGQAWLPTLVEHGRLMPASKTIVAVLLLMPLGALLTRIPRMEWRF
jgi:hypothetical protein